MTKISHSKEEIPAPDSGIFLEFLAISPSKLLKKREDQFDGAASEESPNYWLRVSNKDLGSQSAHSLTGKKNSKGVRGKLMQKCIQIEVRLPQWKNKDGKTTKE